MKRMLALILALLIMVGLLAGCSNSGEETTSNEPITTSTEPVAPPSYESSIADDPEEVISELPLVEDTHTFEFWLLNDETFEGFSTYADNTFYQWMEEQTNVHMEFIHPAAGGATESFQTVVLSQDFPDFVQSVKTYYDGGVDKAISDGFLLSLNDHIDKMPNYKKIVYESEETFIQAVSDEGNLWGIHHIVDRPQGAWIGLGIRQDWLDKAGMTVKDVETIDGLETALRAFTEYTYEGNGPLYLAMGGIPYGGGLSGSWNIASPHFMNSGIINVDGVATYSPMTSNFKDYAAQISEWYSEGLVHKSYIADANVYAPEDRWANGEVGVSELAYTYSGIYTAAAAASVLNPDPNFKISAISSPKLNAEDDWSDIHIRNSQGKIRPHGSMGITTQCSDIDLACAYWNYAWSDEGKIASNWGQVGGEFGDTDAHYYIDETDANGDGHDYCYQPWLMEEYGNVSYIQIKHAVHYGPTYTIWSREWCVLSPEEIEYQNIWDRVDDSYVWPEGVTLTNDEGNTVAGIIADCNTAANSWLAEVITGAKNADTYETELVPQLESFGIETAIECYQAALNRYLDRAKFMNQ